MVYRLKREKAEELRRAGHSYNMIAEKIGVSKSTLSEWLSGMPYTPNKETRDRIGNAPARAAEAKSKQRQQRQEIAREMAKQEIGSLSKRDLFMLGLAIYIGEGSKFGDDVRVINSDPRIIRLAIEWFKQCCGLIVDHFVLTIHMYPDNDADTVHDYWIQQTGLSHSQLKSPQIDKRTNKKVEKSGKLEYGTAHLGVKIGNGWFGQKTFLAQKIRAWMDEVLNNADMV